MRKIAWMMSLMILMTACFPKKTRLGVHQKSIDNSSTVQVRKSTSETDGTENKNITALPTRTKSSNKSSNKAAITDLWRAIEEGNRINNK